MKITCETTNRRNLFLNRKIILQVTTIDAFIFVYLEEEKIIVS